MVRGLYTAASGMLAQQHRIDIVSNNLANASTSGYRADRLLRRAFPDRELFRVDDPVAGRPTRPVPIGGLGSGVMVDGTALSLEEGPLRATGNPLDIAIVGEGFFALETDGGLRLTRDGGFTVNNEGWLVTQDGQQVLGQGGPIRLADNPGNVGSVWFDQFGGVWVDGEQIDTLLILGVDTPSLLGKEGGNRFVPTEEAGAVLPLAEFRLEPGHKEGSNVQVVTEMVRMISAYRAYEAGQRAVHAHDELLDKAVNEVSRM